MVERPDEFIPRSIPWLLLRAAEAKSIGGGDRTALMARLDEMASDLNPAGSLFPALEPPGETRRGKPPGIGEISRAFHGERGQSRETERLNGSFYTPDAIIDRILGLVWKHVFAGGHSKPGLWRNLCDPALGCGFFFLRLIERLREKRSPGNQELRRWAAANLYGVDSDAGALFLARALLWLSLSDSRDEFRPPPGHFRLGDSLLGPAFGESGQAARIHSAGGAPALDWTAAFPEVAAAGGFDALIGNPPYEVLTNFSRYPGREALARAIRESGYYREAIGGQVDLHRCFVERSLALLRPGGALSLVVPLSLARSATARALRKRLLERERAGDWLIFDEKDRAFPGVAQSVCVFRAWRGGGTSRKVRVGCGDDSGEWDLAESEGWGGNGLVLPMPGDRGRELMDWIRRYSASALEDAADMRVGEVDQTLYRDCMMDRDGGCLLARGKHLAAFRLNVDPVPGRARFLDRERFLARKGRAAAACEQRAALARVAQLGIRNMGSRPRLVAALAPPGVYMGNSLNAYLPKAGLPLECLAGLLNSRLLDWLFRRISGNNNINLQEMRRLPFPPDPAPDAALAVAAAYRNCAAADSGGLPAARWELDLAVEDFYGLPPELREALNAAI